MGIHNKEIQQILLPVVRPSLTAKTARFQLGVFTYSYQNSEALNNRFWVQNVYGIVENLKLHVWAKC